jgi:hypothetical protein
MGIDVYMHWADRTEHEQTLQFTGMAIDAGAVGYLRESYFSSSHYATRVLFHECWEFGEGDVATGHIWPNGAEAVMIEERYDWPPGAKAIVETSPYVRYPAKVLRERLGPALEANALRYVYPPDREMAATSLKAFVELFEDLEKAGQSPAVTVSY